MVIYNLIILLLPIQTTITIDKSLKCDMLRRAIPVHWNQSAISEL